LAAVIVGVSPCAALDAAASPVDLRTSCPGPTGPPLTVRSVLDGETLTLDDGRVIRLIGSLPHRGERTNGTPSAPAIAARDRLASLVEGKTIRLAGSAETIDRHGRRLAHVYVPGENGLVWLQESLIAAGVTRAYGLPGHAPCIDALMIAERGARQSNNGLWRLGAFRDLSADDPKAISRFRSTYQSITGTVRDVAVVGQTIRLNFGPDWRSDFSATIERRVTSPDGASWTTWMGRKVRIRGWLDHRFGPHIDVTQPSQVEAIDPVSSPEAPQRRDIR
jgi:endonuclease YncB( thermonuclease family)